MKLTTLFVALAISLGVYSQFCSPDDRFSEVEYFSSSEITWHVDIPYGYAVDYQGNMDTLLLDVFYPDTTIDDLSKRPFVLMIHGGGFVAGSKEVRRNECLAFAQRGFVAISMNYRLGANPPTGIDMVEAIYRAQQDANAALRFVVHHQGDYQIDTSWIFLAGSSAGSITANNVVYSSQSEWNTLMPTIVSTLGTLDTSSNNLTETFTIKGIFNNWGAVPIGNMDLHEMVPQIAFHGEQDNTVDIDSSSTAMLMGSRSIHYTLEDNSICTDITVEPNGGHGIYGGPSGAIFRTSKASCFFKSIFCSECTNAYATQAINANCSETLNNFELERDQYDVFPNPASDHLEIKGLAPNEDITIYNAIGEIIFQGATNNSIDVSEFTSGIYLLSIDTIDGQELIRFVKE